METANINCTRATINLQNGHHVYMILAAPKFSQNGEEQEIAARCLDDFIKWLNPFAGIASYQIEMGDMDAAGQFISAGITYPLKHVQ